MDRDLTPGLTALRLQNDVGAESLRTNTDGTRAARGASALACRSRWIMQLSPRGSEDDKGLQPLVEARIVKDSYHVPHQPVVLERCDGGALGAVQSRVPTKEAICEAVLAWILANPDTQVTAMSIRNRLGHGRAAYEAVVRELPAATASSIHAAVRWGVETGLFTENAFVNSHGNTRKRLAAASVQSPHQSVALEN